MFARKLAGAIAVCAMLTVGSVSYADFDATWQMTTDVVNPALVAAGDEIVVTIACTAQEYVGEPGDEITRVNVSWLDSTAELLDELAAGTWEWDSDLDGIGAFANDTDMSDHVVYKQNSSNGITPAAPYGIGTLTFNAPMEAGTYTIDIGHVHQATNTTLFGDGDTRRWKGSGLTLTDDGQFTFTVPEPTTMVLLGAGLAVTLIRRRRTR